MINANIKNIIITALVTFVATIIVFCNCEDIAIVHKSDTDTTIFCIYNEQIYKLVRVNIGETVLSAAAAGSAHRHGLMVRKNPTIVYKVALVGMPQNTMESKEK